jgi:hypothetical protein
MTLMKFSGMMLNYAKGFKKKAKLEQDILTSSILRKELAYES